MNNHLLQQAIEALRVVAYADQRHRVSCAVFDPVPDSCDCGATETVPLVTKQQAETIIKGLVAEITALRAARDAQPAAGELTDKEILAIKADTERMGISRPYHDMLEFARAVLAARREKDAKGAEPFDYIYETDGPFGLHRSLSDEPYNGRRPDRAYPVYLHPTAEVQRDAMRINLSTFAWGVSRVGDNPKAVLVSFRSEPTDDDLRALHEALRPASGRIVRANKEEAS